MLRHPDNESADTAAKAADHPILNAGNGSREHPTQAFLDLFTMREELGTVNGLTITFVGDLKYGRTVHSLCEVLQHYNVTVQLAAPNGLALPSKVREALKSRGQLSVESETLTPEMVANTDVLYCTRLQKERFEQPELYETVKDQLVVDAKPLKNAKKNMIVMRPLASNMELSKEVDDDPRAAYFRQVRLLHLHSKFFEPIANIFPDALRHVRPHGLVGSRHVRLRTDATKVDRLVVTCCLLYTSDAADE